MIWVLCYTLDINIDTALFNKLFVMFFSWTLHQIIHRGIMFATLNKKNLDLSLQCQSSTSYLRTPFFSFLFFSPLFYLNSMKRFD